MSAVAIEDVTKTFRQHVVVVKAWGEKRLDAEGETQA